MTGIAFIALRVVFFLGLAAGVAGHVSDRVPTGFRRHGYTVALVAAGLLVAARIILRLTVPEEVPSFSG